jgi:isocitrate dehydrogenase
VGELAEVQGSPVDIGGYYNPDDAKASAVMRPSATLNKVLSTLS